MGLRDTFLGRDRNLLLVGHQAAGTKTPKQEAQKTAELMPLVKVRLGDEKTTSWDHPLEGLRRALMNLNEFAYVD